MGHIDELSNKLLREQAKALEAIANIPREMIGETLFHAGRPFASHGCI
jgi:hypothetical protein